MKLGLLFSLLTGCATKPAERTGPGVSVELQYPVLLASDRQLLVKDNMSALTTATGASGPNFVEYTLLDSSGALYTIPKATHFGEKSWLRDLGTSQFQVFLELKAERKPSLEKAKSLVKQMAFSRGDIQDTKAASRVIEGAGSFPQLIEACRKPWEWR